MPIQTKQAPPGVVVTLDSLIQLRLSARSIKLNSFKKVFTTLAGGYISGLRGRGMDFEEVRAYQPGDDIRSMDWRVTARTGKPHTKVYREERERPVYLVVDFNPSMFFGTRVAFKSVIAAQAAALIAWAAIQQGDRVGGLVFSGEHHIELRPRSRQFGVLPLLKILAAESQPKNGTNQTGSLAKALLRLRRVARPGSLIFIFSDFYDLDTDVENHLAQLTQHNDIFAGLIFDPIEQQAPKPGRYGISDGRHLTTMDTTNPRFRKAYQLPFQQRLHTLEAILKQNRIPLLQVATDQPILQSMLLHG